MNPTNNSNEPSPEDRRRGIERRIRERRTPPQGSDSVLLGQASADPPQAERRQGEQRQGERRVLGVEAKAAETPQLVCPICRGPLEYEAALSWALPATYTVDTGYCAACSRRFFQTRGTSDYESVSWPPLCPLCREPIGYASELRSAEAIVYRCQAHPTEVWQYRPADGEWTRRSTVTVSR